MLGVLDGGDEAQSVDGDGVLRPAWRRQWQVEVVSAVSQVARFSNPRAKYLDCRLWVVRHTSSQTWIGLTYKVR